MSVRSTAPIDDAAITEVRAWALSFPVDPAHAVRLGVGQALKRDAVVVRVRTAGGWTGWGESHHGRAHTTVAHLVNHALQPLLLGRDATDVNGAWARIYRAQLAAMGTGTACVLAMSGVDMALWDIRARIAGWPLYRLLGGASRPIRAYAGGVALGWQPPTSLAEEALRHVGSGYRALKLRLGDSPARDVARVQAVRRAVGDDVRLMVDANTAYQLQEARQVIPALDALSVDWLEEPFTPHAVRSYRTARGYGHVPFAAGENHYLRYDFARMLDEGCVDILQPDLSKAGGITEVMRIGAMASAQAVPVHLHTSMTGINMAASLHVIAALGGEGVFEADVSHGNRFRDQLTSTPFVLDADGCVRPSDEPGLGVSVDEAFLDAHPAIEGPAYA